MPSAARRARLDPTMFPPAIPLPPPARRVHHGAMWLVMSLAWLGAGAAPMLAAEGPASRRPVAASTITADWTGITVVDLCKRLSDITGRPVILDRRVDPTTRLTLAVRDEPLDSVLARVAAAGGTRCALLTSTIRLVPPGSAPGLVEAERERLEAIAALPVKARRLAQQRQAWSWPDGATPRDLLAGLGEGAGIELAGLEDIPHDHLAAADLPPLALAERLDLLLAQFDRRLDWSGWREATDDASPGRVPIVPLPRSASGDDRPLVVAPGAWDPIAAQAHPPVNGPGRPAAGQATWTLEVAAPLDQLLATVATRLDLDLELDRAGLRARGVAAGEIVRLKVKDVDRDELLDSILEPLGLRFAIEGDRLWVGPARD